MKYLLDTHTILWYAQGNTEISEQVRSLIESEECFYSIASLWEIAIKQKLQKLDGKLTITELNEFCKEAGFLQIPTSAYHLEKTKNLDFIHRDPFDRLLIAIAQSEDLTIVTRDTIIPQYDVKTIW